MAILGRRRALGLNKQGPRRPNWSKREDNLLRKHHPNFDRLLALLPGRTKSAMKHRVLVLGIGGTTQRWTPQDRRKLKANGRLRGRALADLFPGRSMHAIENERIKLLGLRAVQISQPETLIGDVRREARRRGRSFKKLASDRSVASMFAAITALGGEIYAQWED